MLSLPSVTLLGTPETAAMMLTSPRSLIHSDDEESLSFYIVGSKHYLMAATYSWNTEEPRRSGGSHESLRGVL